MTSIPGALRWASNQVKKSPQGRWGLATRRAWPLAERRGAMAQAFDPARPRPRLGCCLLFLERRARPLCFLLGDEE